MCCFQHALPLQIMKAPSKRCSIRVKKRNLFPNDMVSPAAEKPKAKVLLRYLCVSLQRLLIIASVGFCVCAFFKAGVDSAASP